MNYKTVENLRTGINIHNIRCMVGSHTDSLIKVEFLISDENPYFSHYFILLVLYFYSFI